MRSNRILWTLIFLALTGFGDGQAQASVGFTVSPAATSNNYTGFVTLNITGLTNYQQVKVQTFLDLNSNDVVDPGEPLLDVFGVKESGATNVGGITNISIPYDSNPATNAITTTLSFAPPFENMVGQKIYHLFSNPAGAFTPIDVVMTVTNATLGQSISGVVYSNGSVPLAYAVVAILTLTNQNYIGTTVADANGHYSIALNPGSYILLPTMPGYYTDQNLAPAVVLTNGMSATNNNLVLTNGLVTISGNVYDKYNSTPLGGIFLQAQSGSLFEVAFTDTNGNYTLGATSNNWKIRISPERLARRGYLSLQDNSLTVNAAAGNVANANIGLFRGSSIFYGQVTISNAPVPNVSIECNDDSQVYSGKAYTDANGNYAVVALVNTNALPAGTTWYCAPSAGGQIGLLNSFIFNSAQNMSVSSNQAVLVNFTGLPVTTTVSGRLLNNQGNPVVGVGVGGSATVNGLQYVTAFVDSDTNGLFSFGAADGSWYVNANCCGNKSLQEQNLYELGSALVVIPPANPVINLTVYPANQPVLAQPQQISPSHFDFNLYGANGYNYTIQSSTDLASTNWPTFQIISNFPGGPYLIQDLQATNAARYYRAFQGP